MKFRLRKLFSLFVILLIIGILSTLPAQTAYYSQSDGNFATPSLWDTNSGGGGSSPDFSSGVSADTFIVQNTHNVVLDSSLNIGALTVNSGGALEFDGNGGDNDTLTVVGDVSNSGSIGAIEEFSFANHVFEVGGDLTGSGNFTGSAGFVFIIVDLNGTGDQTFSMSGGTIDFWQLIISNTGGQVTTTDGNFAVTNKFTINSSADVVLGSGTISMSSSNLSISTTTANFDAITNSSKLVFEGTSNRSITINDAQTFYNITLNKSSGSFTFIGSGAVRTFTVNGTLTITNGTIDTTSSTFAYGTNSNLVYNGTSAQSTGLEWTSTINPANVTIVNGNNVTISGTGAAGDRTLTGDLTLTNGELRHSVAGRSLAVQGDIVGGSGSYGVTTRGTLTLNGATSSNITIDQALKVGNLTVNKNLVSNTVTVVSGGNLTLDKGSSSANSDFTVTRGTFIFSSSTQLTLSGSDGTHILTVAANGVLETGGVSITDFDSYSLSSGTVVFNGSTQQETLPTGITIGTVEIDNSTNAITSSGILIINNSLVFTDGIITTNSSNLLRLDSNATIGGTPSSSSMIIGPLQIEFNKPDTITYPLGSGTDYSPIEFGYISGTFTDSSIIEIEHSTGSFEPKPLPTGIDQIDGQSHYIVNERGTTPTVPYSVYMNATYKDGNFVPETLNNLLVEQTNGYIVGADSVIDELFNTVSGDFTSVLPASNKFVVFGRSQISEITWDGGGSDNNWFTANNWDLDVVPNDTMNVLIGSIYSVIINSGLADTSAKALTLTLGDGSNLATLEIPSGDTLMIFDGSASALTVRTTSKLILGDGDGLKFAPDTTYNPDSTNFQSGSTVEYRTGNIPSDTYGHLVVKDGGTAGVLTIVNTLVKDSTGGVFTSSHDITVNGNYTNTAGNATFSGINGLTVNGSQFTVTAGIVTGIVNINSATTTVNGGSFAGYTTLSGTIAQTLNGSATAAFDTLEMNNSSGLTLGTDVTSDTLVLTSGIITTSAANLMTLTTGTAGSATSFVNGPLAITGATGTNVFPVGKSVYRPVTAGSITSIGTPTAQAEVFDTAPTQSFDVDLVRISQVRYFVITVTGAALTGGTVRISYGDDDGVQQFDVAGDVVVAASNDEGATDPYSDSGGENSGTVPDGFVTTIDIGVVPAGTYYFTLGTTTGDNSLPVELSSFAANPSFKEVVLSWKTFSELENQGFYLYRRQAQIDVDWTQINQAIIQGQGNTSQATEYEFIDRSAAGGNKYEYMLESISYAGVRVQEKVIEVDVPVPANYALLGNYPNPFNPTTNIRFQLPEKSEVTLKIYDMRGNLVDTPALKKSFTAGEHDINWTAQNNSGRRVASGMYIYLFQAGNFQKTGKMVLLK